MQPSWMFLEIGKLYYFHLDIRIKVSNPTAFFKKLAKEKREENMDKVHFQVIDSETNQYLKFFL